MLRITLAFAIALLSASSASAHFPWLSVDKDGKASFCFGETPSEKNYKLPEPIAKAEVLRVNANGRARKVALQKLESDDFIGMTSEKPVRKAKMLMSKMTYGMYGRLALGLLRSSPGRPSPQKQRSLRLQEAWKESGRRVDKEGSRRQKHNESSNA